MATGNGPPVTHFDLTMQHKPMCTDKIAWRLVLTTDKTKVTCKNCLKLLERMK